jgi:hypothetical protein
MSQRFIQNPWVTDVFTTTNATPTVSAAASFVIPSGAGGIALMTASARNTSTGASASAQVARTFQNIAGVLSLTGSLITIASGALGVLLGDATMVTALIDFTSSGTTFQPRVTGIAATNIEWLLDVSYRVN